jgi:peroxiredoxin
MDPLMALDYPAPDFELPDLQGRPHRLSARGGTITIINFWSAECPWSERADRLLSAWRGEWGERVGVWTIASNANETMEMLEQAAMQRGLDCVLHDARQRVADLYQAQTTPHAFVVDVHGILRYQGAVDDVTFRQRTPTRFYLQEAVEAVLTGQKPDPAETLSYGCTVVRYAG